MRKIQNVHYSTGKLYGLNKSIKENKRKTPKHHHTSKKGVCTGHARIHFWVKKMKKGKPNVTYDPCLDSNTPAKTHL